MDLKIFQTSIMGVTAFELQLSPEETGEDSSSHRTTSLVSPYSIFLLVGGEKKDVDEIACLPVATLPAKISSRSSKNF